MKSEKFYPSITLPLAIVIAMLILAGTVVASEPKETVLHHFGTGTDGAALTTPVGTVVWNAEPSEFDAVSLVAPCVPEFISA